MKYTLLLSLWALVLQPALCKLMLGTGIADITGPVVDVLFMGMANPSQVGHGLHQRLRARAFVAYNPDTEERVAFVSADTGMGGYVLTKRVVEELGKKMPGMYSEKNVAVSGTHTHSGPSGFLQDVLYQFGGSGWVPQTIESFVDGTVRAITRAHESLAAGSASLAIGEVRDASINRSPTAYLLNPKAERDQYKSDVDLNMTMLKLRTGSKEIGMFNWFAVHPTSLNNTNKLVSGDNKGHASYLFEKHMNGPSEVVRPGAGDFVAAFAATNLGDVSPNTAGPRCIDTGKPCDAIHSTCEGFAQKCIAPGPGKDMYDSCRIIGEKQFRAALDIYSSGGSSAIGRQGSALRTGSSNEGSEGEAARVSLDLSETVASVHKYVHLPGRVVKDKDGKVIGKLCKAALGDSFAGGTTDGPGMFDFTQGQTSNRFFEFIAGFLHHSTPEEKECQHPKGILLPIGSVDVPWPWAPEAIPMQLLRLGELFIAAVPTEMTTMAGRRFRKAIASELEGLGVKGPHVVIAGLSNGYTHYTTTYEEFQEQRYEGGSTIYGPYQLDAYIHEFRLLARDLVQGNSPESDPTPRDFSHELIDTGERLHTDHLPAGARSFGEMLQEPRESYTADEDVVIRFAGANPNNNLRHEGSFLEVQRKREDSEGWDVVAVDGDWETKFVVHKETRDLIEHVSIWEVTWHVPQSAKVGTYRIVHNGTRLHESIFGDRSFFGYAAVSRAFRVEAEARLK